MSVPARAWLMADQAQQAKAQKSQPTVKTLLQARFLMHIDRTITSGTIAESSKAADGTEAPLTNPLALRTANWAPARHGNMRGCLDSFI